SIDAGYMPVLAVDGNAPSYTDPNGQTQTDPGSGNIYVAWSINYLQPFLPPPTVIYSDTVMRVSVDGGHEFGGLVSITNGPNTTSGPAIAIAQGTNSSASNPNTGESVNVLFSQFNNTTPTDPSSIFNQRFPRTPSSYIAHG